MPEPNLLPLNLNMFDINKLLSNLPELPNITRKNIMSKYGLDIRKTSILLVTIYVLKTYAFLYYIHIINYYYINHNYIFIERTCFIINVF